MNKGLIALVVMIPILTFAIIVPLTITKVWTGGTLLAVWIAAFVLDTIVTTAIMTMVQLNKKDDEEDEDQ